MKVSRPFADLIKVYDDDEEFWMSPVYNKEDEITLYVNCNDFFWWGTADAEPVEEADVIDLIKAHTDCVNVHEDGGMWAASLWVARKRNLRPQGACYKSMPEPIKELFNKLPEREIDVCNPYTQDQE